MEKKKRKKELPTATEQNPGFTVQNDVHQPLDMLIEQADPGVEMEQSDVHTDNEDM